MHGDIDFQAAASDFALQTQAKHKTQGDDPAAILRCLQSTRIRDKAIGFNLATDGPGIEKITKNRLAAQIRTECLRYLLHCVERNSSFDEDNAPLDRGEACFELGIPFYAFGVDPAESTIQRELWEELAEFLRQQHPQYLDCIVTHFLEGIDDRKQLVSILDRWGSDAKLKRYAREFEMVNIRPK